MLSKPKWFWTFHFPEHTILKHSITHDLQPLMYIIYFETFWKELKIWRKLSLNIKLKLSKEVIGSANRKEIQFSFQPCWFDSPQSNFSKVSDHMTNSKFRSLSIDGIRIYGCFLCNTTYTYLIFNITSDHFLNKTYIVISTKK